MDGHGDVRALSDEEGNITDTYRYDAYGNLIEREGSTENHYLYTGEYLDSTTGYYYLRARYMDPTTGMFTSRDTYEGSIYDPDTLHKYLYANANPVKYTDPSGHMFIAGMTVSFSINSALNNWHNIHVVGVISGMVTSSIVCLMGGDGQDMLAGFVAGYLAGAATMTLLYAVNIACTVIQLARIQMCFVGADMVMHMVLAVMSVMEGNYMEAVIHGVMAILSAYSFCKLYKLSTVTTFVGNKSTVTCKFDNSNPDSPVVIKGSDKYRLDKKVQEFLNTIKNAETIYKDGKPYMKVAQLNDDYKVIFRRDFDEFSHGEVLGNHWNLEIQTTAGNTKYDLHVFLMRWEISYQ